MTADICEYELKEGWLLTYVNMN